MKKFLFFAIVITFAVSCVDKDEIKPDATGKSATTPGCGIWLVTPYDGLYFRICEDATTSWPQYKKAGHPDPSFTAGKSSDICACSIWESGYAIGVLSKVCVKVHASAASWTQPIYRPEGGAGDVTLHLDDDWICSHMN